MNLSLKSLITVLVVVGAVGACGGEPGESKPFPNPTDACETNEDCSENAPICDELRGCVKCQFDRDCDSGERCHDRACVPLKECESSEQCTSAQPVCDVAARHCVVCLKDDDCGEGARCSNETCEEVDPCVNSRDCPEGNVCDVQRRYCVECISSSDCGEEELCVENTCKAKCASDKECVAQGLLCDREAAHCVECLRDADCPESYYCGGGKCAQDVCPAGEGICHGTFVPGDTVRVCAANGSEYSVVWCDFYDTCVQEDDSASCEPWVCFPGSASCEGTKELSVCSADGLSKSAVDCTKMGGVCDPLSVQCVEVVCAPNEYRCEGQASFICDPLGTSLTLSESCPVTSYCDKETGKCQLDKCAEGTTVCVGNVARTCADDGSSYVDEDCGDEAVCHEGTCKPRICPGNGTFHCLDNVLYACVEGWSRTVAAECSETQTCVEDGDGGSCVDMTCNPNEKVCIGNSAGTCNANGLGLASGAKNCAEQGQTCFEGTCRERVCVGERACDEDGNVRYCVDNGSSWSGLVATCAESYFCYENGDTATCQLDVCEAGSLSCNGKHVSRCRANGSGYDLFEECPEDETCVSGSCLPVICSPSTNYCLNGNVYRCGADGTTNSLYQTCTAAQFCSSGACRADICTGGAAVCSGANLSVCAEDGSGAVDEGTPCPIGEVCVGGACTTVVCDAGTTRCFENKRQTCNPTGTAWGSASECTALTYCDDSSELAVCAPDVCAANQPTCDGETLATCDAYGGSFLSPGEDCSASGKVCNKLTCVDAEELTVAEASTSQSSSTVAAYLNRYSVRTARKLIEIEQYFSTGGATRQFTFYVYRLASAEGYYERVFEKILTASPSNSYVSSGAIDVTLEPGYYYAIGVRVIGGASYSYYRASTSTLFESFARVEGGYLSTVTPGTTLYVGAGSYQYRQRITLEAPN